MNAEQQQLFDEAILRVLDRNESTFGMGATALQVLVGEFGFSPRGSHQAPGIHGRCRDRVRGAGEQGAVQSREPHLANHRARDQSPSFTGLLNE
jgi:hypothetical protein